MIDKVCTNIIDYVKNEILCRSAFMSAAFKYVMFVPDNGTMTFAVYENEIYYNEQFLIKIFTSDNGRTLSRYFLHCVFHFICGNTSAENKENDPVLRLAGDIMVERIIDEIFVFNSKDSFYDVSTVNNSFRRKVYNHIAAHTKMMTEKRIYKTMIRKNTNLFETFDKNLLLKEFTVDTELKLNKDDKNESREQNSLKKSNEIKENARKAAKLIKIKSGIMGKGDISYILDLSVRTKTDYKEFLKKFAVLAETQAEDSNTFDYALYNYGLSEIGAPIIESVEYSESHSLDGFVIAIDTSASCSLEKISRLLKNCCGIIRESMEQDSNVNIYIIQCDYKIRDVHKISNISQIDEYAKGIKINGGGGTNFIPVFEYIEKMNVPIRGLIYFTDGNGTFPKKIPDFETAFVFLESDKDCSVPNWIKKAVIDLEEI